MRLLFKGLKETWDLDVFFPGGSSSPEFAAYLDALEEDTRKLAAEVSGGKISGVQAWSERLGKIQRLSNRFRQAGAFVSCLDAQDVNDKQARVVGGRLRQIQAEFASVMTRNDSQILEIPDDEWALLMQAEEIKPLAFNLNEQRERAKKKLPPEQEMLVNALSVDGYGGWSQMYDLITGRMSIIIEEKGKTVKVSPGQLSNKMMDPDPAFRSYLMEKWEEAWAKEADLCGEVLNRIAGFRLALYKKRGWDSFLQEPMDINRMTIDTLNTMWDTINKNKDRLVTYMKRKKQYLGLEKFGWQDYGAPIGTAQSKMSYDQAADFIVEQFGTVSPKMAALATRAFTERWIEAEDRPGKRMGGFCTSFPESEQSRVFVTFSGTLGNVSTVAHELGHAFHQSVMNGVPPLAQRYAMNVAETASTFSELVVSDAAVKRASTKEEKLVLLDDKLSRSVALLMNIQARFLFETRFYEARKKGIVSVERLNELMLEAQKEAFAGALDLYHPHFWASKLHFYSVGTPFYNFPYTFGYLFSAGIYVRAKEEGAAFEDKYVELLRDTGRMKVEDLAKRHLGVDLTMPEFWQAAIDSVLSDLPEFLRMTE